MYLSLKSNHTKVAINWVRSLYTTITTIIITVMSIDERPSWPTMQGPTQWLQVRVSLVIRPKQAGISKQHTHYYATVNLTSH